MSSHEGSVLTKELQRNVKLGVYGSYQYAKLQPLSALGAAVNGGDVSEFEVPAKCINNSMDRLEFDLSVAAVSTIFNRVHCDGIAPIRQLQLVTRGGTYPMDVPAFNKYTNATFRRTTPFEKLATMERSQPVNTQFFEGLGMCNSASANVRVPVTAGLLVAPTEPYVEAASIIQNSAANAILTIKYRINLGMIKDSFFSVSRDINFNEIVLIRIIWESNALVGFTGTSATDISAGTPAAIPAYAISNLYLFVAIQQNQSIIDMVKEEKRQEVLIPYIWYNKVVGTASPNAQQDIVIRMNTVHGSRMLRYYWMPTNAGETTYNTAYDRDNANGLKVLSFHTEIDGVRTQPYDYTCASADDYNSLKYLVKGSCILSADDHIKYFTHIENFADNYPLVAQFDYDRQNWQEGMPIEKEIKIDIVYNTAASNNVQVQNYVFVVTQRRLVIDKELGIFVDSKQIS